jgi:hypothetical protein
MTTHTNVMNFAKKKKIFVLNFDASQIYPCVSCEGLTPHCNFKLHRQLRGYYSLLLCTLPHLT